MLTMKHWLLFVFLLCATIVNGQQYQPRLVFSIPDSMGLGLQYIPDGSNRMVVLQQLGRTYIFENKPNPTYKIFLDLQDRVSQSGGELGLLGMAFHPNFMQNGFLYVNYTINVGNRWRSYVSRFQVSGPNKDTVLRSTEKYFLEVYQPYSNHNGGWIGFGPDGYLYISFGDGGSGGDPQNRAQNKDSLLGKILRIDVDHESNNKPYSIPPTNPFISGGGRPEVFAYGLRNAWRCSFDPITKKLWVGDVGQDKYEEIDTIIGGGNYGWRVKEGYHCFSPATNCDSSGFQSPIWEYSHGIGYSVTGGYVYRGTIAPGLIGKYIYADLNGKVWALAYESLPLVQNALLFNLGSNISSFGIDQNNSLYIIGYSKANLRVYSIDQIGGEVGASSTQKTLKVYPNPAHDLIQIEPGGSVGRIHVEILDEVGRVVFSQDRDNSGHLQYVNLKNIAQGLYSVVVIGNESIQRAKLIIRR